MQVFAQTVGGRAERASLLSSSALARRAAVQLLGEPSKGDEWRHTLRVQLASYLFTRGSGELYRPSIEPVSQLPLTTRLLEDPDEFFRAARDGQAVAREIAKLAQTIKAVNSAVHTQPHPAQAKARATGGRGATAEPSADANKEAHVFLAIPFSELGQAKAAGAWWHKKYKGWCVLADSDVSKVQRWVPKTQSVDLAKVRDSFCDAMRAHGLVEPLGGPIDDNKWHYVPTADSKGNQKKGAYIFNTKAAVPHGYIKNFKGTAGSWRYDGTSVSPEVRAAYDAQARAQAALRDQELQSQQRAIAAQTASVISTSRKPALPLTLTSSARALMPMGYFCVATMLNCRRCSTWRTLRDGEMYSSLCQAATLKATCERHKPFQARTQAANYSPRVPQRRGLSI